MVSVKSFIDRAAFGSGENRSSPRGAICFNSILGTIALVTVSLAVDDRLSVTFPGSCKSPSSSVLTSSASRIATMNDDKRSIAAENELNCSN